MNGGSTTSTSLHVLYDVRTTSGKDVPVRPHLTRGGSQALTFLTETKAQVLASVKICIVVKLLL